MAAGYLRQVTAYMWLGTCAKEDFFRYAGLRRRNIWPCATPMRQQKTAACAGISDVMYMDSRLAHIKAHTTAAAVIDRDTYYSTLSVSLIVLLNIVAPFSLTSLSLSAA